MVENSNNSREDINRGFGCACALSLLVGTIGALYIAAVSLIPRTHFDIQGNCVRSYSLFPNAECADSVVRFADGTKVRLGEETFFYSEQEALEFLKDNSEHSRIR